MERQDGVTEWSARMCRAPRLGRRRAPGRVGGWLPQVVHGHQRGRLRSAEEGPGLEQAPAALQADAACVLRSVAEVK